MTVDLFFKKFDQFADAPNAVAKMLELVLRLAFSGGLSGKSPSKNEIPEGWEKRTIESIASSVTPGFACSKNHQVEGGLVHLRTHNISTLGILNFDLLVKIDPKMVDQKSARSEQGTFYSTTLTVRSLLVKLASLIATTITDSAITSTASG